MTRRPSARRQVLAAVAEGVLAARRPEVTRVAIDGVDGAGKTVFADELTEVLGEHGVAVIRASVDGFHHPPEVRYGRGRWSAEGFLEDSYDYEQLRCVLLDPLGPGGNRRYRQAIWDVGSESPVDAPEEVAPAGAVLVLDGIFLHRAELRGCWDRSVFLHVPFEVSVPRGAARGYGDPDPGSGRNRRYVGGQRLYLARCRPAEVADVVIDNTDLDRPVFVDPALTRPVPRPTR